MTRLKPALDFFEGVAAMVPFITKAGQNAFP